ncbi:MAG: diguanylate cyclase, partial [Lachnospiraceae bacterium]|nr:diguanylate cyclase [Lachnospiraceae bacterium]
MSDSKKRFAIGKKMYVFIIATILFAVASVCALSYVISASQIDNYFKRLTNNSARIVASQIDAAFLKELRQLAESEEYQALREQAEETDNDSLVIEYLREKGMWDRYEEQRNFLIDFVNNMDDIKYLYAIVWGDAGADHDMYLLDADDVPFYETGYYEEREAEFAGTDPTKEFDPVISHGDWGWLCSRYVPVYDEDGQIICHIGCDVGMEDVMKERYANLTYVIVSAIVCTIIVLAGAFVFINRTVVWPLNRLTKEMAKFSPSENANYEDAGVIKLDVKSNDEIRDIYEEIRSQQMRIVDYVNNIIAIRRDKERAEDEARSKDEMLGKIAKDAYKDALTGIGNKAAYIRKINALNEEIQGGLTDFAVVMIDVNGLKAINDNYGHSSGDLYLKG